MKTELTTTEAAVNSAKLEAWMTVYTGHLADCVKEDPTDYAWPVENVPHVAARMRKAFEAGTYNADSHAIKRTCKTFGIKHTQQAIRALLTSL